MDRPVALVTAPFRGAGLERLRELADVVLDPWIDHHPIRLYNPQQLAERIEAEGASIVVCEADECKGPVFELDLTAVGSTRGDPTNVDLVAATKAGVPVLHAPGRNADAVAEHALALLFAAVRHVVPADGDVRRGAVYKEGSIPYQRYRAWELNGRTAGVIGLGAIGRAVRWRLEGIGMRVLASDPYVEEANASLDELLDQADVITIHAPVNAETTGMIGEAEFARMKDGVVFVNAAREALHDRAALTKALQSGKVAAAGLDHFAGEHLDPDDPLAALPNLVLTPHIGGATYDTEENHSRMIADDLALLLSGERPVRCANPEVLP